MSRNCLSILSPGPIIKRRCECRWKLREFALDFNNYSSVVTCISNFTRKTFFKRNNSYDGAPPFLFSIHLFLFFSTFFHFLFFSQKLVIFLKREWLKNNAHFFFSQCFFFLFTLQRIIFESACDFFLIFFWWMCSFLNLNFFLQKFKKCLDLKVGGNTVSL